MSGNAKNERLDDRAKRVRLADELYRQGVELSDGQRALLIQYYGNIYQRIRILPEVFGDHLIRSVKITVDKLDQMARAKNRRP